MSDIQANRRLADFIDRSEAEEKLIAELATGITVTIADGALPGEADTDSTRIIRADLIRFLLLGGDMANRPHEKGLRILGARVTGLLDLTGCRMPRYMTMANCRFEAAPNLKYAVMDGIELDGSVLPGLTADGIELRGVLHLRRSVIEGELRLLGARIGSVLDCSGARLHRPGEDALSADRAEIGGSVYLKEKAQVAGTVRLLGARIGANLDCEGLVIEQPGDSALMADRAEIRGNVRLNGAKTGGEVRFSGARISGQFFCAGARIEPAGGAGKAQASRGQGDEMPDGPGATAAALTLRGTTVTGPFMLRGGASLGGVLDLTAASLGDIRDSRDSWPAKGHLRLDRCRYGAFIGGPEDAASRLEWLERQDTDSPDEEFRPQPYQQLAQALRDAGHEEEAKTVLIAKEGRLRLAERERLEAEVKRTEGDIARLWPRCMLAVHAVCQPLLRMVGYGYRPLRAAFPAAAIVALGTVFVFAGWRAEVLLPTASPPAAITAPAGDTDGSHAADVGPVGAAAEIGAPAAGSAAAAAESRTPTAADARPAAAPSQSGTEIGMGGALAVAAPRPATEFVAFAYAFEAFVPIVSLGQTAAFKPDMSRWWGYALQVYLWIHGLAGYIIGGVAAGGVLGLFQRK